MGFRKKAKDWNHNCFRNIFHRKRCLMARLEGIDKRRHMGQDDHLGKLQRKLWEEYNSILHQEELFWYQKSRSQWLKFGDRNTKYFHLSTIIRGKLDRIEALMNNNEDFIIDPANFMIWQLLILVTCTLPVYPFFPFSLEGELP